MVDRLQAPAPTKRKKYTMGSKQEASLTAARWSNGFDFRDPAPRSTNCSLCRTRRNFACTVFRRKWKWLLSFVGIYFSSCGRLLQPSLEQTSGFVLFGLTGERLSKTGQERLAMRRVRFFCLLAALLLLAAVIVFVFRSQRETSRVRQGKQGQERPLLPPRQDNDIGEKILEEGEDSSDDDDFVMMAKVPSMGLSDEVLFAKLPPKVQPRDDSEAPQRMRKPACVTEISSTINCAGVGLCSFLLYNMQQIAVCHRLGLPVHIRWTACESQCGPPNGFNYRTWWFKDPPGPVVDQKYLDENGALCMTDFPFRYHIGMLVDFTFKEPRYGMHPDSFTLFEGYISPAVRRGVHVLFQKYFRPKDFLQQEVDEFVSQHFTGKIVIGVHVRATDHGVETVDSKIPSPLDWVKSVHTLLFNLGLGPVDRLTAKDVTLFVASDNLPALDVFEKAFPKLVCHTQVRRAKVYREVFWNQGFIGKYPTNATRGAGVLKDAFLLSRCHYMLHGESSVAATASYLNPDLKLVFQHSSPLMSKAFVYLDKYRREKKLHRATKVKAKGDSAELKNNVRSIEDRHLYESRVLSEPAFHGPMFYSGEWKTDISMKLQCIKQNIGFSLCPNMRRGRLENVYSLLNQSCPSCGVKLDSMLKEMDKSSEAFFAKIKP